MKFVNLFYGFIKTKNNNKKKKKKDKHWYDY